MKLNTFTGGQAIVAALLAAAVIALSGCAAKIGEDEPIRTSNPVADMHSELSARNSDDDVQVVSYSYNDAMETGRRDNKYVMVLFYTDWCKWCKKLKEETLTDPQVAAYLRDNFTVALVNAESSDTAVFEMRKVTLIELTEAYGVTQFPTVWFLEPNGKKAKPLNGYLPPEDFLVYLKYINTGSYRVSE